MQVNSFGRHSCICEDAGSLLAALYEGSKPDSDSDYQLAHLRCQPPVSSCLPLLPPPPLPQWVLAFKVVSPMSGGKAGLSALKIPGAYLLRTSTSVTSLLS